ncbi:Glycosyltransferase family 92 protein ZK381.2 [Caenorhabditis elegans]|uniref:Glycosyltransferase family 92 protein ZK381.2 n=1 Tax=Caenorhabditis elegans TaxID=6239 RepID=YPTJ_CAEEL|nr:Glycosyltransferase family 92 protein ZK381.2 [Caenorhabditis elegans]Q23469.1 RecName: Full=Glycosyltransferase family 92 protein ZK381.2 [Caenorhabditis elegans]CCD62008.1 Glycosyltransferase family 92 protein ZK381.2 [Caenorhabditis elegans]|eukprot:NP_501075.1 Glycosyltransferase family 92 protein ZK381.2 [Caenorhabditis elegans]
MRWFINYKPCLLIILIFNSVILLFILIRKSSQPFSNILTDPSGTSREKLPVSHAFINSVYYYPTSKSLGENALAFTMAIDQHSYSMKNHTFTVLGYNSTDSVESIATSQTEGISRCRYVTMMARTNTVENLEKLKIESQGVSVEVPFRIARYSAPKPVIICISPQFAAEQWQMFVMHVHAANRFGGHLHIYLTSIIESYFQLMQEYERQGYITLDYWLRMKFSNTKTPYYEPNENVEWRHQAGAQTDCLLQYKEAAEYIAFFDMDDILFPKNYPTYLEEFNSVLAANPGKNYLFYGRREHEFVKASTLTEFSFTELVQSLRSSQTVKRGKVVVRPEAYNSTWIHNSKHVSFETSVQVKSPTLVHVQLPVDKNGKRNDSRDLWKIKFGPLNETIREDDIRAIEDDINRIKNLAVISSIGPFLPSSDFYLPIVFKCYFDSFYKDTFVTKIGVRRCPNADICDLPQREDYKCIHSDAQYYSGPDMQPVTYHFTTDSFWSKDIGCYQ